MGDFFSVGNHGQPIKVVMLGFQHEMCVGQAFATVRSLQKSYHLSEEVEPWLSLWLLGEMAPNGLHILWLFMPMKLDAYEVAEVVVSAIEQRFVGMSMECRELLPQQQLDYAEKYCHRKRTG